MIFDWDEANREHLARHDISPAEAEEVIWNDPLDLEAQNIDGEERFTQVGTTNQGRTLVIATTWRDDHIRVVTGWDAPQTLRRKFLLERFGIWHPRS